MQRSFEVVARTSSNYALTATDEYLGVGTREAPITITLPSRLSVLPGYSWFIKDESAQASAFPITIRSAGGEEIEGASSYVINVDGGFIEITNNSARFLVLSSHVSSVLPIDAGGTDAATAEEAVDNLGLDVKAPVRVASKTNIDITAFPLSVNSETLVAGAGLVVSGSDLAVDAGQGLGFSGNQVYIDTVLPGNLKAIVTNKTGSTLTSGTAVAMRINSDGILGAIPADSTTGVIATHVVAGSDILNDASGTIIKQIVFGSLDTSTAAAVNSPLYLGVAGAYIFDAAPSAASDIVQVVGRVMVKDATEGVIAFQVEPPITYGTTNLQSGSVTAAKLGATFSLTFESENLTTPGSRLYTGAVTGDPVVGATLLQASSGATGTITAINGNGSFDIDTVTGTWDATNLTTGTNPDLSNFTFTPVETLINTWLITESPLSITSITSNDGTILPVKSASAALATNQSRYQPTIPAPLSPIETLASDGWTALDIDFASKVITIA